MNKLVSLVITTRNEEKVLGKLLQSIKKQTYKNIETILVDNDSTDDTLKIAKKMRVKIFNAGPERSAQRNYGVKIARGEYVLILDADMELTRNVVKACVELMQKDNRVGALVIPEQSIAKTFWEKVKAYERSFYNLEGDTLTDAARFFKKEFFLKIGGYDETITGPEDWDLPDTVKKLGHKIDRISAKIYHYERIDSLFKLARKKFYYALRAHRYLSKQKISFIGPKTIYFLRPVFYKSWKKIAFNPILSLALMYMLAIELIAGGLGYFWGRIRKL